MKAGLIFFSMAMILTSLMTGCDYIIEKRVVKRFREIGFIPELAEDIFVRDNHSGFHGDGLTFLTFKVSDDRPRFWTKDSPWKVFPLEKRAQRTYDVVIKKLNIPKNVQPDIRSKSLLYFIDDSRDYRENHTGHLFIMDEQVKQHWYLNWTE